MKIVKDGGRYVICGNNARDAYVETEQARASSRVLEGSDDDGYMAEYVGYGEVGHIPIKAIYLLGWDEADDEGDYDWDVALSNGRLEIDVDKLNIDAWEILQLL